MDRWNGKVAVVTGASDTIGAAIVRDLVKAGMKVVGLARRVKPVEAIAKELKNEKGKLLVLKCDVSKKEEIKTTFAWIKAILGGVDVLVNNAGIAKLGKLVDEGSLDSPRSVLDTNVWGLCICTREAVSSMLDRNVAGHIIHINSITKPAMTKTFNGTHSASKFAAATLMESLGEELIHLDTKIKVTSISPGAVANKLLDIFLLKLKVPMLQPEDIAQAVRYTLGTPEDFRVHEIMIRPNNRQRL